MTADPPRPRARPIQTPFCWTPACPGCVVSLWLHVFEPLRLPRRGTGGVRIDLWAMRLAFPLRLLSSLCGRRPPTGLGLTLFPSWIDGWFGFPRKQGPTNQQKMRAVEAKKKKSREGTRKNIPSAALDTLSAMKAKQPPFYDLVNLFLLYKSEARRALCCHDCTTKISAAVASASEGSGRARGAAVAKNGGVVGPMWVG